MKGKNCKCIDQCGDWPGCSYPDCQKDDDDLSEALGLPPEPSNAEQPAFPGLTPTGYKPGMTKAEWFAAYAPAEIPQWFQHSMEEYGECPKSLHYPEDYFSKQYGHVHADYIHSNWNFEANEWVDPNMKIETIEEEIRTYDKLFDETSTKIDQWRSANQVERYFQWRLYYGQMMAQTFEKCRQSP